MELNGAHVLITGASRGIGAALARAYAKEGAKVSLVARSTDALKSLADELDGFAFTADLLDPDQVDELIARVELEAGPIDVLVNNAGLETSEPFEGIGTETIRDVARLNFEAPMVLTRQVLPGMLARRKGHIVFLSSLAGTGGFPGLAVYAGTKAGVSNFVASLRMEMRDTPITTTVVAPGPVDTEMWDHIEDAGEYADMLKRLRLFQLIPKKSPELIAKRTVAATKAERRHVRTPRRLLVNHLLREAPTRITESLLSGVKVGPVVDALEADPATSAKG
ncbi:MAG: SDR family NAD(P)-dependent oxidoreductase [Acidimicrobiales bacterium]